MKISEEDLDVIIAAINFADIHGDKFRAHLKEQGHEDTSEVATSAMLNEMRWGLSDIYHKMRSDPTLELSFVLNPPLY